jgi:hypothetical protein
MTLDPAGKRLFEGGSDGSNTGRCLVIQATLRPIVPRDAKSNKDPGQIATSDGPQRMPASQCNTFSTKRALCDAFGLFIPTGSRSSPLT